MPYPYIILLHPHAISIHYFTASTCHIHTLFYHIPYPYIVLPHPHTISIHCFTASTCHIHTLFYCIHMLYPYIVLPHPHAISIHVESLLNSVSTICYCTTVVANGTCSVTSLTTDWGCTWLVSVMMSHIMCCHQILIMMQRSTYSFCFCQIVTLLLWKFTTPCGPDSLLCPHKLHESVCLSGLKALTSLVQVNPLYAADHQQTVLDCLTHTHQTVRVKVSGQMDMTGSCRTLFSVSGPACKVQFNVIFH